MKKYKIEVGGFVTVYRHRIITVSADTPEEAKKKAVKKFVDLQQNGSGSPMCEDATVDSIERINYYLR